MRECAKIRQEKHEKGTIFEKIKFSLATQKVLFFTAS
jgi:hypothetical protein